MISVVTISPLAITSTTAAGTSATGFTRSLDSIRSGNFESAFVSPDFRAHSVAYYARPFFDAFDRERLDVIAYAHVPNQDAVTADLRELTTEWRDIVDWNNQRLADEVRKDRVDILVDLAGLTRGLPSPGLYGSPSTYSNDLYRLSQYHRAFED